jgi:hypothetical protein
MLLPPDLYEVVTSATAAPGSDDDKTGAKAIIASGEEALPMFLMLVSPKILRVPSLSLS